MPHDMSIDLEAPFALQISGDFQFEEGRQADVDQDGNESVNKASRWKQLLKKGSKIPEDSVEDEKSEVVQAPFALRQLELTIPKGGSADRGSTHLFRSASLRSRSGRYRQISTIGRHDQ